MTKPVAYQARGALRRKQLIETCRIMLADHHVGAFGLAEIAALADIPKTSVYHFFPRIEDLLAVLALDIAQDLLTWLNRPMSGPFTAWSQIVAEMVARGRSFYDQSRAALEIQLGVHTPPDIKNRDRANDRSIGILLKTMISDHFIVPQLFDSDAVFFRAIEIADLMFVLSVREHGTLTDFYTTEATRAANAYLELYLPPTLPLRA